MFQFQYTATQRTGESARYFTIGLFGRPQSNKVWFPEPLTKDPILRVIHFVDPSCIEICTSVIPFWLYFYFIDPVLQTLQSVAKPGRQEPRHLDRETQIWEGYRNAAFVEADQPPDWSQRNHWNKWVVRYIALLIVHSVKFAQVFSDAFAISVFSMIDYLKNVLTLLMVWGNFLCMCLHNTSKFAGII